MVFVGCFLAFLAVGLDPALMMLARIIHQVLLWTHRELLKNARGEASRDRRHETLQGKYSREFLRRVAGQLVGVRKYESAGRPGLS